MWGELPPEEDWVAVVEITTTEPVEEEVLEEKPEEWKSEEENIEEEINSEDDTSDNWEEDWEAAAPELPASEWDDGKLEPPTPAEQDRMDEVLKAIKTFFPNENTEDVLVRMVTKLIDL